MQVEWVDADKTRARFSLPGREERNVEHIDALVQLLGEIRAQVKPAPRQSPPPRDEQVPHGSARVG